MNRFLDELIKNLKGNIPDSYVKSNVDYYREYILEEKRKGRSEKEILAQLGEPRLIAKNIIDTCPFKTENSKSGYYEEVNENGSRYNSDEGFGGSQYGNYYFGENNDGFNKKVKVFKLFNKMMGTRIGRVFTVIGMVLIMALFFGLLIGVIGIFMTYVLPVLAIIILLKIIVAAIRGK